jgi:hypothetical protein
MLDVYLYGERIGRLYTDERGLLAFRYTGGRSMSPADSPSPSASPSGRSLTVTAKRWSSSTTFCPSLMHVI